MWTWIKLILCLERKVEYSIASILALLDLEWHADRYLQTFMPANHSL